MYNLPFIKFVLLHLVENFCLLFVGYINNLQLLLCRVKGNHYSCLEG